VKTSETSKKRHRGRNLAAGRCEKPNELTQGDCRSRRKVYRRAAVTGRCEKPKELTQGDCRSRRKVYRRAAVAGRCGKPKELTQGYCGSRRKVYRRAAVVWRKGNVFRKILTWGNWGSRSKLAPAGMRMTHRARVALRKKHGLQRQGKDDIAPRTPKGRMSRTLRPSRARIL
jgi:hypothetical protein